MTVAAATRPTRHRSPADHLATEMRELGRCQRRILERIGDLDRREAYRADGSTSMVRWVMERFNLSYPSAGAFVSVARELPQLPALADALSSGSVSFDQLRLLVRIATPSDDADLAAGAARWSVDQTESHVRLEETRRADAARRRAAGTAGAAPGSPPTAPLPPGTVLRPDSPAPLAPPGSPLCDPTPAELRSGTLRLRPHAGGGTLDGWLPAEDFAAVESALLGLAKGADRDPATGTFVPLAERMASALVGLVCRDGADGRQRVPSVVVHCDVGLLSGESDGTSVATINGAPVPAELARRLACDAQLRLAVEADGLTLDLGRSRRVPSVALTREVMRRDRTCRFPGCGSRHFLQVHHIVWWENGGTTDLGNLAALCPRDHRRIHHKGFKVEGDANGELRYISPDGRTLRSMPDPSWSAPKRRRTDRPQR